MLASSVGPNLTKLLHDQLDLIFACGLSEPLRSALVSIARHIPPLLKTIQGTAGRHFFLSLNRLLFQIVCLIYCRLFLLASPIGHLVRLPHWDV
jgi:hypothetical protein